MHCWAIVALTMPPHVQATLSLARQPVPPSTSNMSKEQYLACVETVKEHIQAGDIFQLVLSHRFDRRTFADPFEVYRCGLLLCYDKLYRLRLRGGVSASLLLGA